MCVLILKIQCTLVNETFNACTTTKNAADTQNSQTQNHQKSKFTKVWENLLRTFRDDLQSCVYRVDLGKRFQMRKRKKAVVGFYETLIAKFCADTKPTIQTSAQGDGENFSEIYNLSRSSCNRLLFPDTKRLRWKNAALGHIPCSSYQNSACIQTALQRVSKRIYLWKGS